MDLSSIRMVRWTTAERLAEAPQAYYRDGMVGSLHSGPEFSSAQGGAPATAERASRMPVADRGMPEHERRAATLLQWVAGRSSVALGTDALSGGWPVEARKPRHPSGAGVRRAIPAGRVPKTPYRSADSIQLVDVVGAEVKPEELFLRNQPMRLHLCVRWTRT